jgi:hypothetical protein
VSTNFLGTTCHGSTGDARAEGCTMLALCCDAARQPGLIKATFAAGIEGLLVKLASALPESGSEDENRMRARTIDMVARAVGSIVLSRACPDDSPLADEILEACRLELLRGRRRARRGQRADARRTIQEDVASGTSRPAEFHHARKPALHDLFIEAARHQRGVCRVLRLAQGCVVRSLIKRAVVESFVSRNINRQLRFFIYAELNTCRSRLLPTLT